MPRVMAYLRKACQRYDALHPLLRLLDQLENRQAKAGYSF
jgi:aminoglycoside/choline kinase family phosphotransferase